MREGYDADEGSEEKARILCLQGWVGAEKEDLLP